MNLDSTFFQKNNGLLPTNSTFLARSQLTMSIHWACYCRNNVYVYIVHICDSVWSFCWVESNLCRLFIVCLCSFELPWRFNYQEVEYWNAINGCTHATILYLSLARTWIYITCAMVFFFVVSNDLRREVVVGFVDIGWTVDHHCLNFLFIIKLSAYA